MKLLLFPAFALAMLALSSCDSKHSFTYWSDRDYNVLNGEFSMLVTSESGVQVSSPLAHSSGTRVRTSNDYWRVFWKTSSLREGVENPPVRVEYIGHFEEKRARDSGAPLETSGYNLEMAHYTGDSHVLTWHDGHYFSPKLPMVKPCKLLGELANEGRHFNPLSRSRRHILLWKEPFTICDAATLAAVRELPETETLKKFRTTCDKSTDNHFSTITDDLRQIIFVPHNGNDSPQGFNHHLAWIYDAEDDKFSEVDFRDEKREAGIMNVESWEGRLYFFVLLGGQELVIYRDDHSKIAALPATGTRTFNFNSNFFWSPAESVVWTANGAIDLSQSHRQLSVTRYDYQHNITTTFHLDAGPVRVP